MEITSGIIGLYGYGEMWLNALEMNQVIRVPLHQGPAFFQSSAQAGLVVSGFDFVLLDMGELQFYSQG